MKRSPSIPTKGIFFDMGGTLVFPVPERIADVLSRATGIIVGPADVLKAIHHATALLDKDLETEKGYLTGDWWGIYFGYMKRFLGLSPEPSAKCWKTFTDLLLKEHLADNLWNHWVPGVADTLEALARDGYYLGVISNSDGRVQEQINKFGIQNHFRFVIDSKVVGCEKPGPEIFHLALEKSGLAAKDVLYVGDFVNIDFRGATAVGMSAVIIDPLGLRGGGKAPTIPALVDLVNFVGV